MSGAELKGGASDVSLVWAIRSGDESAMATLYDRYSSLVYAVALRVLGDTGAAEDVLQEVFMQLWRNPGSVRLEPRQPGRVAGGNHPQPRD